LVGYKECLQAGKACADNQLPGRPTVLGYAEANSSFRRRLPETYHGLPYAVQARADMFSPLFFEEVRRLKSRGLSNREIGEKLGVSAKTVVRRLKEVRG
jgi:DNA-binding NarL/FixJ family response regulator